MKKNKNKKTKEQNRFADCAQTYFSAIKDGCGREN